MHYCRSNPCLFLYFADKGLLNGLLYVHIHSGRGFHKNGNKTIINALSGSRVMRVPNRFFGIPDLAILKVRIRDFRGKKRRNAGLESGTGSKI